MAPLLDGERSALLGGVRRFCSCGEASFLYDRPDMRCSVCVARPPGPVRREAGFLLLAAAREPPSLLAPRGGGAAAGRERCRGTRPGPGSRPARTAPPEEIRRAGSAPEVPVPVQAKVRSVAPWPSQRAPVQPLSAGISWSSSLLQGPSVRALDPYLAGSVADLAVDVSRKAADSAC
jgi:hypothetical protein